MVPGPTLRVASLLENSLASCDNSFLSRDVAGRRVSDHLGNFP